MFQSAELAILLLNLVIVLVAYGSVYPNVAGNNFNRMTFFDTLASILAIAIVGSKFWGSETEFTLFIFKLNWFWFTLICYAIVEIPVLLWYCKKYKVKLPK